MKKFSDLNIVVPNTGFSGDKIKIHKVFNREIEIHDFKVEQSKFTDKDKPKPTILLTIQLKIDNEFRVVFCASSRLQRTLELIPKENFPFTTTIINDNQGYSLK
jgi:hypothetical protein